MHSHLLGRESCGKGFMKVKTREIGDQIRAALKPVSFAFDKKNLLRKGERKEEKAK